MVAKAIRCDAAQNADRRIEREKEAADGPCVICEVVEKLWPVRGDKGAFVDLINKFLTVHAAIVQFLCSGFGRGNGVMSNQIMCLGQPRAVVIGLDRADRRAGGSASLPSVR
ncbi:hypothetical protein [Bradyrhizobium liaoningense]|uniref:hypothetical protein n=1 Tax=Bradyrhizobium liaoningense TaxID=43992 RepID=UPI001BA8475F|nr:hypothetical protein [Bradyrhizobium liaoningense]